MSDSLGKAASHTITEVGWALAFIGSRTGREVRAALLCQHMNPWCTNTSDGMLFGLRQPYLVSCKLGGKRRVTEGHSSICAGRPSGDSLSGRKLADVPVVITAVAEVSRAIRRAIKLQQHLIKNHIITCSVIRINGLKGQENGSAEIAQHSCANKLFSKPTALMLPSVLRVKLQFLTCFSFSLNRLDFCPMCSKPCLTDLLNSELFLLITMPL